MRTLPQAARFYAVAMVAAGAITIGFVEMPVRSEWPLFGLLALSAALTSLMKIRIPTTRTRATMSPSFLVVAFASILLLGSHQAVLVAAVGAICQSTVKVSNRKLHQLVFDIAALVVTVQVAGLCYQGLGGTAGSLTWPGDATPLAAAVMVYFLVHTGSMALAVALSSGQPVRQVWRQNFLWSGPLYLVGAGASALIVEIVGDQLWGLVALGALAVYLTYNAYCMYVGRLEDERRHRQIVESLSEGMAVIELDGRVVLWNDALHRIVGIPREEVLGRPLFEAVPALGATEMPAAIDEALRSGQPSTIERFTLQAASGDRIVQVRVFPFADGATVFWNDVTARTKAEMALTRSEERYALAASGANDGLWDWDLSRGEIYLSTRWKAMLGIPAQEPCASPDDWLDRSHPDETASIRAALDAHIAGETTHFEFDHRLRHEDGTYRWVLCRGAAVRQEDGQATRLAGSQTDITDRVVARDELRDAALHDTLTGLPNRSFFMELLAHALGRAERQPDRRFAVLFLDVDRFKVINDSLGHLLGDELLVAVARRVKGCLRGGDSLARLGGDEFTILVNDLADASHALKVAGRIQAALRAPFLLGGREVFTTASIGIALSSTRYTYPDQIMRDADTAMYRSKALGKARHTLFDESMHSLAVQRLSVESDLRNALDRGEFTLHYQPIVCLRSGGWTGFEALIRWQLGGRDIQPGEFIPVAEETGLIEPLGAWVLQEACRQVAAWHAQFPGLPRLGVAVNVSPRQLIDARFPEVVMNAVRSADLDARYLRLEITETTLMENPERAEVVLRELGTNGIKILLDDFGTGFSSLSYLHRFSVDTLKIDRSFIARLSGDRRESAFIQSIIALAGTLGTHVIAEGVETEGQFRELIRLGCGEAQGFLFANPLPAAVVAQQLGQDQARIAAGLERVSRRVARPVKERRVSSSPEKILAAAMPTN